MVRWLRPSTRNMAQSSKCLAAKARAANATATALSNAANKATRLKNFSARSSVWLSSGRPDCVDSMRTPRKGSVGACAPEFVSAALPLICAVPQATNFATAASSPATASR